MGHHNCKHPHKHSKPVLPDGDGTKTEPAQPKPLVKRVSERARAIFKKG